MKLIIAEKPSVAKQIASALGTPRFNKASGYYEAGGWRVSFALGHIIGLAEPQAYDEKYKHWKELPVIPKNFKYRVLNKKRFSALKKLIQKADVIVNACDAGREGELIFREIIMLAKPKKTAQIKRMWLSAMTKEAVQNEIKNLKPISKYDNLSKSAFARAIADWLVGINATRAFTVRSNSLYTIGRVQTPTLYAIINRERERAKQKETYYYQIVGTFHSVEYQGTYYKNFDGEEEAKRVVASLPKTGKIEKFQDRIVSVHPELLYDLTSLQREANTAYHFSAQKTLNIAQQLYEMKLTSYPRTDSRYLPQSVVNEVIQTAQKLAPMLGVKQVGKIYSVLINDAKVSDHYALVPTGETDGLSSLSADQRAVYFMILKRFISVFLGDATIQKQKWLTVNKNHVFNTVREAVLVPGWKLVYGVSKENPLPKMSGEHELVKADVVRKKKGKTPHYSDATLLKFMERAGDYGLGTPATRAGIIERLLKTKYIRRMKNTLIPEQKGYKLIEALEKLKVSELLSPELTAMFEKGLDDIKSGKISEQVFINRIVEYTKQVTNKLIGGTIQ